MRKISLLAAVLSLAILSACSGNDGKPEPPAPEPGALTVTFDFEKQSGYASNQFAVWIEDMEGNLIKTLYATKFTANGGYKNRPNSLSLWVEKSGLASMTKSEVDAVSGATPKAGAVFYAWDLTDQNGGSVTPGEYRFIVEGSLRWKNRVLYTGVVDVSGGAAAVQGNAEYIYEASDEQPALSENAAESNMIGAVTAIWEP